MRVCGKGKYTGILVCGVQEDYNSSIEVRQTNVGTNILRVLQCYTTVLLLTYKISAASLLDFPSMTSVRTSTSRLVNLIGSSSCPIVIVLISLISLLIFRL